MAWWQTVQDPPNSSTTNYICNFPISTSGTEGFSCNISGSSNTCRIRARLNNNDGTGVHTVTHPDDCTVGDTWQHGFIGADWANDVGYTALDGNLHSEAEAFTNTTFNPVDSGETMRIGTSAIATPTDSNTHNGRLAWLCAWNILLTTAELAALAAGCHPLKIRPGNLVLCIPIFGTHSPEIELITGRTLTINGTLAFDESAPPVEPFRTFYPVCSVTTGVAGVSGDGAFSLPNLTVEGDGATGIQGDFNRALPNLTVAGTGSTGIVGDGDVTLPNLSVSGDAAHGIRGDGDFALPLLEAGGFTGAEFAGDGAFTLPLLTVAGEGRFAWIGDGAFNLPALTVASEGATGIAGDGDLTLPQLTAAGEAHFGYIANATFALPGFSVAGEAAHGIRGDGDAAMPNLIVRGVEGGPDGSGGDVLQRRTGGFGHGFG